ncbi:MAG: PadR family transcriptional regulator [Anaerolineaceae bacterium]|nr:PadR family transcriptional regulator [Anaerolineaceae bacterium]
MSPRHSSALTIEHVLLALVDQRPMHGYELYQELCGMKGISLIWNIKQGLLYAILDKLEGKGFLTSQIVQGESYPPRKYFHLTETGKNSLEAWIRTPERRARDIRQEFLAKLIIARRYGISEALALIHLQQQACQTWFDELDTNIPTTNQEQMDEWFVYSFRVNRVEGILKWLKKCELEIEHLLDEGAIEGDLQN